MHDVILRVHAQSVTYLINLVPTPAHRWKENAMDRGPDYAGIMCPVGEMPCVQYVCHSRFHSSVPVHSQ